MDFSEDVESDNDDLIAFCGICIGYCNCEEVDEKLSKE